MREKTTTVLFEEEFLNNALANGGQEELLRALYKIARCTCGMRELADTTGLNYTTLYKMLSPKGNPKLKNFTAILSTLGMRIVIVPIKDNTSK